MTRYVRGYENRGGLMLLVGALIAISGRFAPCQTNAVPPSVASTPVKVAPSDQMAAYEVATIKPWDGQGFAMPLRVYIQLAFGIPPNRIGCVIGPDWINSARYVIQAKPPDSIRDAMKPMTTAEAAKEIERMRQSLLADRFQLKAHFETREMPIYQLVLAKGGSKLKENRDSTKSWILPGASAIKANAAPITALIGTLESAPDIGGRAVIDKTGLSGLYDISLKWTPMDATALPGGGSDSTPSTDAEGASLFTAIQDQLGLKLVSAKGPVQVLIVDHIERPSEN
jgi:uncharacterized protein (TIGR03435 family)